MTDERASEMLRFLEATASMRESRIGAAAFFMLDRVDQKTGTLLMHVSIMMGMTAIVYDRHASTLLIRLALQIELVAYLLITLGCLWAISMARPGKAREQVTEPVSGELTRVHARITAYRCCLFATLVTTLLFIATFVAYTCRP